MNEQDLSFMDQPLIPSSSKSTALDKLIAELEDTKENWEDREYQPQGPYYAQMCKHRASIVETIDSLIQQARSRGFLSPKQEELARKLIKTRR